jgi:hypothetical protein
LVVGAFIGEVEREVDEALVGTILVGTTEAGRRVTGYKDEIMVEKALDRNT